MASLEELLAKEGFKKKTNFRREQRRTAFTKRTVSMPVNAKFPIDSDAVGIYDHKYRDEFFEKDYKLRKNNFWTKKSFNDVTRERDFDLDLDRIATKAMVSILTGHLRRFFKDETFRESTYLKCASCVSGSNDVGVVTVLKNAMRCVERAAVGECSPSELKKASLELSVITGLHSADTYLAACSHLYLAVIFKFRKKDAAAAKHVLNVFGCATDLARTHLLPGLWDRFFLPHLARLEEWYEKERATISRTRNREKKTSLLDGLYGEILDRGTYKLTVYYKDWLEGIEPRDLPSILVPDACFPEKTRRVLRSVGSGESSPRYDRFVDGCDMDSPTHEAERVGGVKSPVADELCGRSVSGIDACAKGNELILQKLARGAFRLESHMIEPDDDADADSENPTNFDPELNPAEYLFLSAEPEDRSIEHTEQASFFSSIPTAFNCPLTGQMFVDPVTLETGRTYERSAISEWFDRGNATCPVTKRTLTTLALPNTNVVVLQVINEWTARAIESATKREHARVVIRKSDFSSMSNTGFLSKRFENIKVNKE